MRKFCSSSMKRTMVLTNNPVFCGLDLGKVSKRMRKRSKPTTRRYIGGDGTVRYVGTRSLKKSQILSLNFGIVLTSWILNNPRHEMILTPSNQMPIANCSHFGFVRGSSYDFIFWAVVHSGFIRHPLLATSSRAFRKCEEMHHFLNLKSLGLLNLS